MEIERIDGYTDPRFSPEVLRQHGAFLADGQPWSFRIVSDREAVVSVPDGNLAGLEEAAACFRFYAEHITAFYDEAGQCLLRLPEVARREVEIAALQPTQFSVDREKCAAVGSFLRSGSDLVIPVAELEGALCTLDGHTRLYTAWQRGIRTAMVFVSQKEPADLAWLAGLVAEARRGGVFHVPDMALYGHQEQEEKWTGWCQSYFAGKTGSNE